MQSNLLSYKKISFKSTFFHRKESREAKLSIAECHLKLGEISMESGMCNAFK